MRYLPYGQERWNNGASVTDFGFTSQRKDVYMELVDFGARWYDPQIGRFISPDTIIPDPADSQSFNRYGYVNNNPVKYTDPSGHCGGPGDLIDGMPEPAEEVCGGGGSPASGEGGVNPQGPGVRGNRGTNSINNNRGGGTGLNKRGNGNPLEENAPSGSGNGSASGNNAGTGGQNGTQTDLYKTGNTKGPYDPRIEGYNQTYPEQKVDINIDKNGKVIPNQGGASTYETVEQLPVRGHVWKLPKGSETPGFNVNPDGQPFGNQPPGHVSLVPNKPMSPQQCIECFRNFNWEPVLKPDGFQLKLK